MLHSANCASVETFTKKMANLWGINYGSGPGHIDVVNKQFHSKPMNANELFQGCLLLRGVH